MKITIITSSLENELVVKASAQLPVSQIIIEKRVNPGHFVPFYVRRFTKTPFNTLLEIVYQVFIRLKKYYSSKKALPPQKINLAKENKIEVIEMDNANSVHAYHKIKQVLPDYILLAGCSIIKPNILSLAQIGTINIHTGINPLYRGGGNPFACINYDWDNLGATIHWVDSGIDTGKIIKLVKRMPEKIWRSMDTFNAHCYAIAVQMLVEMLLESISTGKPLPIDNHVSEYSRYYPQLNIISYIKASKIYRGYVLN
jgi:methionyl-tRNA formyltransferase